MDHIQLLGEVLIEYRNEFREFKKGEILQGTIEVDKDFGHEVFVYDTGTGLGQLIKERIWIDPQRGHSCVVDTWKKLSPLEVLVSGI